jgi:arylsulfatase A-like enzyme
LTSNLDKVRNEGLTLPVCIVENSATTPSFTTLLTGLYSPRHGVRLILGNSLDGDIPLLTEELARLGYHTYAEVTGPLITDIGLGRGFEKYEYRAPCDYLHTAWGDQLEAGLRKGKYQSPWFVLLHLWELHLPRQIVPPTKRGAVDMSDYELAVASLDFQLGRIFDAAGDHAFIIVTGDHGEKTKRETFRPGTAVDYLWTFLGIGRARGPSLARITSVTGPSALHHLFAEFVAPALKEAGKRGRRIEPSFSWSKRAADIFRLLRFMPKITPADLFVLNAPLKLTAWLHRSGLLDEKRSREKVRRFLAGSRPENLNEMFARLMISSCKKNYEEGHTLHVYDYLVKVPLVMRWKDHLPAGKTFPRMVRQPDILPTVLDMLGSPPNRGREIDGRSFRPLFERGGWKPKPAFLSAGGYLSQAEIQGVRTEGWKYSFGPYNDELPEELYGLREDPGELENLAPEKPGRCAKMKGLWKTFSSVRQNGPDHPDEAGRKRLEKAERDLRGLGYLD